MSILKKVHDPKYIIRYKTDNGEQYIKKENGKKEWQNDHKKFDLILAASLFCVSLFFFLCPQFGIITESSLKFMPDIGSIQDIVAHPSYPFFIANWGALGLGTLLKCRWIVLFCEIFGMAYLFLPLPF